MRYCLHACRQKRADINIILCTLSKPTEIQKCALAHTRSNLYCQKITAKENWDYSLPSDNAGGRTLAALRFVLWRQAARRKSPLRFGIHLPQPARAARPGWNRKQSPPHLGLALPPARLEGERAPSQSGGRQSLSHRSAAESSYSHIQKSKDLLVCPQPYTGPPDQSLTSSVAPESTRRQFTSVKRTCQFWLGLLLEDDNHARPWFQMDLLQGKAYPSRIHRKFNSVGCISDMQNETQTEILFYVCYQASSLGLPFHWKCSGLW